MLIVKTSVLQQLELYNSIWVPGYHDNPKKHEAPENLYLIIMIVYSFSWIFLITVK